MIKIIALLVATLLPCLAATPEQEKGKTMGNPAAPLLLELYSDFSCPACKHLHEAVLPAIVLDYVKSGKAFLVFREFPLNIAAHKYSRQAAALAVAAGRIGKYQTVNDILFRNQLAWGASGKVMESVMPVLTPDEQKKVRALVNDPSVIADVQSDVERGTSSRISQTPTIVVTYKLRQQPWTQFEDYSLFRGYLDGLLKK
ncbi:MAG: thioredoxin domain-containing protein [Candidatus Solibacter sp.]